MKVLNFIEVQFDVTREETVPVVYQSYQKIRNGINVLDRIHLDGMMERTFKTQTYEGMKLIGHVFALFNDAFQEDFTRLPAFAVNGVPDPKCIATLKFHVKSVTAQYVIESMTWLLTNLVLNGPMETPEFIEYIRRLESQYRCDRYGIRSMSIMASNIAYQCLVNGATEDEIYARL